MIVKLKVFIYNLLFIRLRMWFLVHFNPLIKSQQKYPPSIPIIIINFNQLFYLKKLVNFLVTRKFENIVIIDNNSTYLPLLDYYKTVPKNVTVEYMHKNFGHMVFFESAELQKKYGQGFYVVTDADIVPNDNLPEDFMNGMLDLLLKEFNEVTKVGFALDIENIPDYYVLKDKVIHWETQFWTRKYGGRENSYLANIDTTFALYKPKYPTEFKNNYFVSAIRLANDFTSQHGGWLIDHQNLTEEQEYYKANASESSSWNFR